VRAQQSERGNLSAQNPVKVRKILQRYIEGYIKGYTNHKGSYEYLDNWYIEGDPDWFHTKKSKKYFELTFD